MSEKVLGTIGVFRPAFMKQIAEILFFAPDRTIVARKGSGGIGMMFGAVGAAAEAVITARKEKKKEKELREFSLEDILNADKNNYAIPNSDITEVELKKYVRGAKLNIKTSKKYGKAKWYVEGAWKDVGEKYENMLRPIFGDKLSVKK